MLDFLPSTRYNVCMNRKGNDMNGVWKNEETFEAYRIGESVSFTKGDGDGGCVVYIDGIAQVENFYMNGEQFAAFKEWIKESENV